MACPRTDSGFVEPYLWVPHPPGLPINAGMRLALEGPAGTLNGPSAGLHTCSLSPAHLPSALSGAEQEVASSERWQTGYSGRHDAPGGPLWSQVVRIRRPIRSRPPPWTASGLHCPARLPPGATGCRESTTAPREHCLSRPPTPLDAEICSTRPFQMKIWEAGGAGGRQMCESFPRELEEEAEGEAGRKDGGRAGTGRRGMSA